MKKTPTTIKLSLLLKPDVIDTNRVKVLKTPMGVALAVFTPPKSNGLASTGKKYSSISYIKIIEPVNMNGKAIIDSQSGSFFMA
jgi:hypothetical protein